MTFLARLSREPLVHFLLIGAAVFALYALVSGGDQEKPRDRIVVTEGRVQQLARVFAKTWQRPPTQRELRGLIDAYIKEEVYYREAVKLGLDRDDTLIRRRMQQKMEFLSEPGEDVLAADDAALQAFLDDNKSSFRAEPKVAFEQVFINRKSGEGTAKRRAGEALEALKSGEAGEDLGDPTLLPAHTPLSSLRGIERDFGDAFAKGLTSLPLNAWAGPIDSPFGLHLVRVSERIDGYDPALSEVRDEVLRSWRTLQREEHQKQAYGKLLAKYEILLPELEEKPAQAGPAP